MLGAKAVGHSRSNKYQQISGNIFEGLEPLWHQISIYYTYQRVQKDVPEIFRADWGTNTNWYLPPDANNKMFLHLGKGQQFGQTSKIGICPANIRDGLEGVFSLWVYCRGPLRNKLAQVFDIPIIECVFTEHSRSTGL